MLEMLNTWLSDQGAAPGVAFYLARAITMTCVILSVAAAGFLVRRYLLSMLARVITRTKTQVDHVLAVVPEFDLRVYQTPSGNGFKALGA